MQFNVYYSVYIMHSGGTGREYVFQAKEFIQFLRENEAERTKPNFSEL